MKVEGKTMPTFQNKTFNEFIVKKHFVKKRRKVHDVLLAK